MGRGARHQLEGERQQRVTGEDRGGFVERLPHRRPAAAQLVVVHRRQVVVGQRIAVQAFDRRRRIDCGRIRQTEDARAFDDQKGPETLAAAEDRVAHGGGEFGGRRAERIVGQQRGEAVFHTGGNLAQSLLECHVSDPVNHVAVWRGAPIPRHSYDARSHAVTDVSWFPAGHDLTERPIFRARRSRRPNVDVLTGPPAVPPAAAEGVAEASEPELGPPEEPPFEPAPVAETADAEPPPSAEPAIEVAELGRCLRDPVVADDVAVDPAIVEGPPVEEPAPEVAVDAAASDHDIGAQSVSAEPSSRRSSTMPDRRDCIRRGAGEVHVADSTSEPAAELPPPLPEPTAAPPLPEIPSRPLSKSQCRSCTSNRQHNRTTDDWRRDHRSARAAANAMRRRRFRRRSLNHLAHAGASGCAVHCSHSLELAPATPRSSSF